jgi:hypothetical protein
VGLELLAVLLEIRDPVAQLSLDLVDGPLHRLLLDDVVGRGPDRDVIDHVEDLTGEWIEVLDALDLISEELNPICGLGVRRVDLEHLSARPEGATPERRVVAPVLHADQLPEDVGAVDPVAGLEELHLLAVELRRADSVDAGNRGNDDHIAAGEQRRRRGVAQAVDLVVDGRVLLDIEILRRHVRLGLVVVVVAHEVLDGVLGEELPELVAELRRQGLVVGDHQRRALNALDHPGHREGLARAGCAEQRLEALARVEALGEGVDRLGLVGGGAVRRIELEISHRDQRTGGSPPTDTAAGEHRPPRHLLS